MSETFDINKKTQKRKISFKKYERSHYDVLYPFERKEIISFDKSKISKLKGDTISLKFLLKMMKKNKSENFWQINKNIIWLINFL